MSRLPYWEKDLDFQVSDLFPYDWDRRPVSTNRIYGERMEALARGALSIGSEFLYVSGLSLGTAGTMTWDGSFGEGLGVSLGFTLMLGYSSSMEEVVLKLLDSDLKSLGTGLMAGVTECLFWSQSMPREVRKIIMIATGLPLKDEVEFIDFLIDGINGHSGVDGLIPYYAELFGMRRSAVSYETDDLLSMRISSVLQSFEMSETRQILGPAPDLEMPPLFEMRFSPG